MAASVSQPIVSQCHYDPMFKVDVLLHTPLHEHVGSQHEYKMEIMALCLSLDSLIKQELLNHPDRSIDQCKCNSSFTDKARVVVSNMQQIAIKNQNSMNCDKYLRHTGLDHLFPRPAEYITRPDNFSLALKKTSFHHYIQQFSALNHALNLARQINDDALHIARPKYLAHQIAILYQSLNNIPSGSKLFSRHGKNIEENFQTLKSSVSDVIDGDGETLVPEVRDWIIDLTDNIIETITSLPLNMTQEILPVAEVIAA